MPPCDVIHLQYFYKSLCVVQVSRLLEWTGHLQTAVQYMALCVRLPSPPDPTSPSSQNSVKPPTPNAHVACRAQRPQIKLITHSQAHRADNPRLTRHAAAKSSNSFKVKCDLKECVFAEFLLTFMVLLALPNSSSYSYVSYRIWLGFVKW